MNDPSSRYADWKAPADDGQILIWPEPAALAAGSHENFQRLRTCDDVRVQGIPLPEIRRRQRQWIGHDDTRFLLATGHQTELYHPGVWVKNVLVNAAADKLAGVAYHFAVDTDAPKHLHLRWPGGGTSITDDDASNTAPWCGLLRAPTPLHLTEISRDFVAAAKEWNFKPLIEPFIASLRRLSLDSLNLSAALTDSMHRLDWELGLRHNSMLMSPAWVSEPYLVLLHHLMARAGEFAAHYNDALAEYRRRNGIRTSARPMPDLRRGAQECESPFWVDLLSERRRDRAVLHRRGDAWALVLAGGAEFVFDSGAEGWAAARKLAAWLRSHDARIAPRALTLTLFFRLLLADQFIHGIGGGRYDQVTDRVIETYFKLQPPRFSVTTATLYFPAAAGKRRINLRPLLQEGRRIRHGMFSRDKMAAIGQIDALPRNSLQRQEIFVNMHRKLAAEFNSPAMRDWEQRIRSAEHESAAQRTLFDRELFFAIQPAPRLKTLIEQYNVAMRKA